MEAQSLYITIMIAQALVNIFLISKEKQQNIQFLLGLEIGFCCWLFPHLFFFLISKTQRTLCQLSLLFSFQLFHRTLVPFHYVLSVNYLLYLISKFYPVLLNQFPLLLLNEKGFFLFLLFSWIHWVTATWAFPVILLSSWLLCFLAHWRN